jgi:hypothetical protein
VARTRFIKGMSKARQESPSKPPDEEPDRRKSENDLELGYYWIRSPRTEWQIARYDGRSDWTYYKGNPELEVSEIEIGDRILPPP